MQAHLQGVEGEAPVDLDHQFAVEAFFAALDGAAFFVGFPCADDAIVDSV
ncbi:hypothetical protein [Sinorhizobium meliloti]